MHLLQHQDQRGRYTQYLFKIISDTVISLLHLLHLREMFGINNGIHAGNDTATYNVGTHLDFTKERLHPITFIISLQIRSE